MNLFFHVKYCQNLSIEKQREACPHWHSSLHRISFDYKVSFLLTYPGFSGFAISSFA